MIAIIDYGAGNLHSVKNALDFLGAQCIITGDRDEILNADKVILPGVGAFGDAMKSLEDNGLSETVKQAIDSGKPFLGICLGLHLLFEESEESPGAKGLGVFKGKVVKIPDRGLKIPHMGWNSITLAKSSKIFNNIGEAPYVYFVHSYYIQPSDKEIVSAYTEYGQSLSIAVENDNVFATQFHPEKSGEVGMKILKNFIEL
ncbi:MAG: imidazole glycerol phosphate synthase subunit HisH [Oscillospiraceae bacterium]|nr:imidazole glycerol phosphate synthase subunit HisH [Oscillospiraceae bacterium]